MVVGAQYCAHTYEGAQQRHQVRGWLQVVVQSHVVLLQAGLASATRQCSLLLSRLVPGSAAGCVGGACSLLIELPQHRPGCKHSLPHLLHHPFATAHPLTFGFALPSPLPCVLLLQCQQAGAAGSSSSGSRWQLQGQGRTPGRLHAGVNGALCSDQRLQEAVPAAAGACSSQRVQVDGAPCSDHPCRGACPGVCRKQHWQEQWSQNSALVGATAAWVVARDYSRCLDQAAAGS